MKNNKFNIQSVLLFGGTGFIGKHFEKQYSGKYRIHSYGSNVDVRNYQDVISVISEHQPDVIINLASISTLNEANKSQAGIYDINIIGNVNVLEAIRKLNRNIRYLFISSSQVYGAPGEDDLPLLESSRIMPVNAYGYAKYASECVASDYYHKYGIDTLVARQFNCIGPGQDARFMVSDFAKQSVERSSSSNNEIKVGNIHTTRDYVDVRDVIKAYDKILANGKSGQIYNICSGSEVKTSAILEILNSRYPSIMYNHDPKRVRPDDILRLVGSRIKIKNDCDWEPQISLNKSVNDICDYWEKNIHV